MKRYRLMVTTIIIILSYPQLIWAQKELRNVFVGDAVPNIKIEGIKDANFTSLELTNFSKDKLLILDFWATWCSPCVRSLPIMDSLQREFEDRIQVITVTKQSEQVVRDFFNVQKRRQAHVSPLPKVFEDKVLYGLFPHLSIPHYVWIKDGKVVAITERVTRQEVESALRGGPVDLVTKVDFERVVYDGHKIPLIDFMRDSLSREKVPKPFTYSFITRFVPELGYNGGYRTTLDSLGNMRITAVNVNMLSLLKTAYGEMKTFIYDAGVDIRTDDSLFRSFGLSGMAARPLIAKKAFCYEIVAKDSLIFRKMREDLKFAVPEITVELIDTVDTCIVLEKINDKLYKFVSDLPPKYEKYIISGGCSIGQNITMSGFRTTLEGFILSGGRFPIVDETGFTKRFNIEICDYRNSIEDINRLLIPYGLQLSMKLAKHKRLVIDKRK